MEEKKKNGEEKMEPSPIQNDTVQRGKEGKDNYWAKPLGYTHFDNTTSPLHIVKASHTNGLDSKHHLMLNIYPKKWSKFNLQHSFYFTNTSHYLLPCK